MKAELIETTVRLRSVMTNAFAAVFKHSCRKQQQLVFLPFALGDVTGRAPHAVDFAVFAIQQRGLMLTGNTRPGSTFFIFIGVTTLLNNWFS